MLDRTQIKVIIIGNDGISRKYWVAHDAQFYENKYKIDPDAIYQSGEGGILGQKMVPTIMFRANNVIPISYKTKPSIPDPDEMGSSISRAAWAIAELMRKSETQLQQIMLFLLIGALILSGAGTWLAYQDGQKLDKIQESVGILRNQTMNSGVNNPFIPIIPTYSPTPIPQQTSVPIQTPIPTASPTPVPAISVA